MRPRGTKPYQEMTTHYIPLPQPQAVYYPKDSFLFQRIGTLAAVSAGEDGTLKVEHHPI